MMYTVDSVEARKKCSKSETHAWLTVRAQTLKCFGTCLYSMGTYTGLDQLVLTSSRVACYCASQHREILLAETNAVKRINLGGNEGELTKKKE